MNDRQRLCSILRSAWREAMEKRAGLPRITINDPPKRRRKSRTRVSGLIPDPQLRLRL